jgi:hypothetical protein
MGLSRCREKGRGRGRSVEFYVSPTRSVERKVLLDAERFGDVVKIKKPSMHRRLSKCMLSTYKTINDR